MLKQITRRTADLSSVLLKILTDAETTVFKACLKEIAIYFSLDPIESIFPFFMGCACFCTGGGWGSRFRILDIGRWRSLAFLKYKRVTDYRVFEVARYTVSRIDMITLDKIWLKHAERSNV